MILLVICLVAFGYACNSQDSVILERWETSNHPLAIRVTEYQEKHFPLSKFRYVFEAKSPGSGEWREIMTTRTDDDIQIPREQVRFINDQAAYVFMVNKYAITTNVGNSWSTWTVDSQITNGKYPGQFLIKEALVNLDGSGTLILVSRSADGQNMQFQTDDFGHSWTRK